MSRMFSFKIDNGNFWFQDSWEQFWTDGYYVSGGEGKSCTCDTEAIDAIGFSVFQCLKILLIEYNFVKNVKKFISVPLYFLKYCFRRKTVL